MNSIKAEKLCHSYIVSGRKAASLKDIDLEIEKGELVSIIGKNGCGKSTLAKHFNMLLPLQDGSLSVAGFSASDRKCIYKVRRECSMVFQNPDSQFVSSIVKEDIAFGLKNFNLVYNDTVIKDALSMVGMEGFENRRINTLSGGQKQRLALAGVLAIHPNIIILDEATTMLPPKARADMLDIISDIHRNTDTTIIMITQYVDEAILADRVVIMNENRIVMNDTPEQVFHHAELLEDYGLEQPFAARLYFDLKRQGIKVGAFPKSVKGLVDALCQ